MCVRVCVGQCVRYTSPPPHTTGGFFVTYIFVTYIFVTYIFVTYIFITPTLFVTYIFITPTLFVTYIFVTMYKLKNPPTEEKI